MTCHSSNPCMLSGFSFLTATTIPAVFFEWVRVFSSIHPLCTLPNPPSPRTVSGLKFLVADFNSANVNIRRLGTSRMRPSGYTSSKLMPLPVDCPKMLLLLSVFPVVGLLQMLFGVKRPEKCKRGGRERKVKGSYIYTNSNLPTQKGYIVLQYFCSVILLDI